MKWKHTQMPDYVWLFTSLCVCVCVSGSLPRSHTKNINLCVVFIPEPLKNSFCLVVVVAVFVFALIFWIGFSRFFLLWSFLLSFFTPSTQMRKKSRSENLTNQKTREERERIWANEWTKKKKNFSDTYIVSSRAGFCYLNAKHNASKNIP